VDGGHLVKLQPPAGWYGGAKIICAVTAASVERVCVALLTGEVHYRLLLTDLNWFPSVSHFDSSMARSVRETVDDSGVSERSARRSLSGWRDSHSHQWRLICAVCMRVWRLGLGSTAPHCAWTNHRSPHRHPPWMSVRGSIICLRATISPLSFSWRKRSGWAAPVVVVPGR